MFHFPHKLTSVQQPIGANSVGALLYQEVTNNARCQFLGRPREHTQGGSFGENTVVDVVFSLPAGTLVDVGWRMVYENKAYIVEEVEPQMDVCGGHELARTVFTRREKILDGATNYTKTL